MSSPDERTGNPGALTLATLAFGVCFYAWALLGPLGPDLQDQLGLSDTELALTVAIPVLLGSLMRIPLGVLTDRHGGRRVFTALMAFTPLPLVGLALFNDSLDGGARSSASCSASPAPRSRSASRSSTPGTRPSARATPSASTASAWAGPSWAALDRAADRRRDQPRRAVLDCGAALVAVMAFLFWRMAEDAPGAAKGRTGSMFAAAVRLPRPGQQPRLGAHALLLHGLRRLRRDVPLPAEAAHTVSTT